MVNDCIEMPDINSGSIRKPRRVIISAAKVRIHHFERGLIILSCLLKIIKINWGSKNRQIELSIGLSLCGVATA